MSISSVSASTPIFQSKPVSAPPPPPPAATAPAASSDGDGDSDKGGVDIKV